MGFAWDCVSSVPVTWLSLVYELYLGRHMKQLATFFRAKAKRAQWALTKGKARPIDRCTFLQVSSWRLALSRIHSLWKMFSISALFFSDFGTSSQNCSGFCGTTWCASKIVSTNKHFQNSSCICLVFLVLAAYLLFYITLYTWHIFDGKCLWRGMFLYVKSLTCHQMHIFFKWNYCIPLSFPDHTAFILIVKRKQSLICTY